VPSKVSIRAVSSKRLALVILANTGNGTAHFDETTHWHCHSRYSVPYYTAAKDTCTWMLRFRCL